MPERVLITDAGNYSFKAEDGSLMEGCNITYFTGDMENTASRRGLVTMKTSGDKSLWNDIQQVPGWYDIDFRMRPGAKGRPTLKLTGISFVTRFELSSAPSEKLPSQSTPLIPTPEQSRMAAAMNGNKS